MRKHISTASYLLRGRPSLAFLAYQKQLKIANIIKLLKMFHKLMLASPLLSLTLLSLASPLQQREAAPGFLDDLLRGILPQVTQVIPQVQQLIQDVLNGVQSAIDNNKSNKPVACSPAADACCACMSYLLRIYGQS